MPITEKDLEELFEYHPPDSDQTQRYVAIRAGAKEFARVLLRSTPPSPDQTAAIRKLRECVMTANGSIALKGKF